MEVISRRERQSIVIDEKIHVTVLKIYKDHVRLGISSPNRQPSFWEADVYVSNAEQNLSRPQWWQSTFRGVGRFDSLFRDSKSL